MGHMSSKKLGRNHLNRRGEPKIKYPTMEAAEQAAQRRRDEGLGAFDAYRCYRSSCAFHVGRRPTPQQSHYFQEEDFLELGPRVLGNMKIENTGNGAKRERVLRSRARRVAQGRRHPNPRSRAA